jgi:uncharacterized damage-inducible protein DinB
MTIHLTELLHWERAELDAWERFFRQHPEALDFPFAPEDGADARMSTVRGVVHHIVAVERRYADRLAGAEVTAYDAIPQQPADALFAAARDANRRVAEWVASATEADLARVLEFGTISAGVHRGTARKIAAHAILHGVRTWAQVATVVRLRGVPSGWQHDLLLSDALA